MIQEGSDIIWRHSRTFPMRNMKIILGNAISFYILFMAHSIHWICESDMTRKLHTIIDNDNTFRCDDKNVINNIFFPSNPRQHKIFLFL